MFKFDKEVANFIDKLIEQKKNLDKKSLYRQKLEKLYLNAQKFFQAERKWQEQDIITNQDFKTVKDYLRFCSKCDVSLHKYLRKSKYLKGKK